MPGDVRAPSFLAALERVRAAARRRGKAYGLVLPDGAAAAVLQEEGWTFLAIGSDSALLPGAVTAELARARLRN